MQALTRFLAETTHFASLPNLLIRFRDSVVPKPNFSSSYSGALGFLVFIVLD
jgi:hypothetical protein